MSKPVVLTGLRANNDLHIGNYLGALLPIVDMAQQRAGEYQINLFVPDLHSFTTPIDHTQLQEAIMQNLRVFVAAGLPLNNPDVHIYRQSYVPAHSELTWILDCFTGFGEMRRMTQFKDKMRVQDSSARPLADHILESANRLLDPTNETNAKFLSQLQELTTLAIHGRLESEVVSSVGLFNYPVLMAADILLYGASYVPVGEDQTQHLEFTRDIAERMNRQFGELFVVPRPVKDQHEFFGKDQGLRIKDLADPSKKMSKSDESGKGVIFMTDTPDEARKKIMSATTDSLGRIAYDKDDQPGIANLLDLLALFSNRPVEEVTKEYEGQTQYGILKAAVADAVTAYLQDFQERLHGVDDHAIAAKLLTSEASMNQQANATLLATQKAVGLRSV